MVLSSPVASINSCMGSAAWGRSAVRLLMTLFAVLLYFGCLASNTSSVMIADSGFLAIYWASGDALVL